MAVISTETLKQKMAKIIGRLVASNKEDFSYAPGRMVSDIFIKLQGVSDVQQNALTYLVAVSNSINDILALKQNVNDLNLIAAALNTTSEDVLVILSQLIDAWGENFRLTRKQPTKSVGSVKMGSPDPPTVAQTVGVGIIAKSPGGTEYVTTATSTLQPTAALDPVYLMYLVEVAVQAVNAGSAGNADSDTVNSIVSAVNGFSFVTNPDPITGGNDLETDEDFGARILARWQAIGRTTEAGIVDSIDTTIPTVAFADIYVAKQGDALAVRGNGKTDVWVKAGIPAQVTETFSAFNDPDHPNAIVPANKPVISLVSVGTGAATLVKDQSSAVSRSVQSLDRFQFQTAPVFPVTLTYTYDMVVRQSQDVFGGDGSKAPLGQFQPTDLLTAIRAKILVKAAIPVDVDYVATIKVAPGQNAIEVKQNAQQALATLSNGFRLGVEQFKDDLDEAVDKTNGVVHITKVALFARVGQAGVEDSIPVGKNEYVRLRNATIFTT